MIPFLKKYLIWILLLGTLIGLNEILLGSIQLPFRSAILGTIMLLVLMVGRFVMPQIGSTLLITAIAVLFRVNNLGCHHSCTTTQLLCGPMAVLMLGSVFELFTSVLVGRRQIRYYSFVLPVMLAALTAFGLFGLMNTYIIQSWDVQRLNEYILIKGSFAAFQTAALSLPVIWLADRLKGLTISDMNAWITKGVVGLCIILLWFFGSFYL
jgi:hypothetical protein